MKGQEELFNAQGRLIPELKALAPLGNCRISANPHAKGVRKGALRLTEFTDCALKINRLMPRAVLWDMDGTLIDSGGFHWISWRATLAKEGISITHDEFLESFDRCNHSIISRRLGTAATPERIQRIGKAKEELYRGLIRAQGIQPLPGVARWVRQLHERGWLQAIASAAPRANIDAILDVLGAAGYFKAVVAAEALQRGRPDPQVYLDAAALIGASPARCIVVEDAVAGIESARNAGMKSIGVGPNGKLLQADIVIPSLDLLHSDAFESLLAR